MKSVHASKCRCAACEYWEIASPETANTVGSFPAADVPGMAL